MLAENLMADWGLGEPMQRKCRALPTPSSTATSHTFTSISMASGWCGLFELCKENYLLVVGYFSRYPEATKLTTATSSAVIKAMKSIFSRHGIPEVVCSDNGPQFDCQELHTIANNYRFRHQTSSPHFPRSNGSAKRSVKAMKKLLRKSTDPYIALLNYRATPLQWCELSPSELLMGRQVRTTLP